MNPLELARCSPIPRGSSWDREPHRSATSKTDASTQSSKSLLNSSQIASDSFGEWSRSSGRCPVAAVLSEQPLARRSSDRSDDRKWPGPGFPGGRCKLTLAGGTITSSVSFLAQPRIHTGGHQQVFGSGRFGVVLSEGACGESANVLPLEHCPNCGGELKIIAAILDQPVIEKILTHLGLQARAPPCAPARGQALQAA